MQKEMILPYTLGIIKTAYGFFEVIYMENKLREIILEDVNNPV